LIGPHAGFVFSGPNAAWAYKAVDPNAYDRVFILGPSHKVFLDFMATTACSQWETPIGSLKVDLELVGQLCQ
jgi:AmmeMemoRadiSam system protein B